VISKFDANDWMVHSLQNLPSNRSSPASKLHVQILYVLASYIQPIIVNIHDKKMVHILKKRKKHQGCRVRFHRYVGKV